MPDHVRAQPTLAKTVFSFGFHLFDLIAYEVLYRLSPARKHWFFNGGYLPLDDDYVSYPEFEGEDHSAMMYHQAGHTQIKDLKSAPRNILDIGCGQGGGLVYLSRLYPDASLWGTERSRAAVSLARKRMQDGPNAHIKASTSRGLDFAPGAFDLVVSVGAPTYFGLDRFVLEVAKVLGDGGVASFSGGYRQGDHAVIKAEILEACTNSGLEMVSYRDITQHTFASLKADIPRREREIARVPWPFRLYAVRWADMPGSPEYQEYEDGRRADFACVLRKRADG